MSLPTAGDVKISSSNYVFNLDYLHDDSASLLPLGLKQAGYARNRSLGNRTCFGWFVIWDYE
jgi:hypothetical protein